MGIAPVYFSPNDTSPSFSVGLDTPFPRMKISEIRASRAAAGCGVYVEGYLSVVGKMTGGGED